MREAENLGVRPVLVCAPMLRSSVRRFLRPMLPDVPVLAYTELLASGQVQSAGVVSLQPQAVGA